MSDDIAIKVDGVSKTFRLPHERVSSVKSAFLSFYKRRRTYEKQQVLNNVSFEVKHGEFFGIVGRNGSGKSTLLKLLAGIYSPSKGKITVNGKLTPFIELGVGFNPELSGRENVYLNGALLGFNRTEMTAMYDDIVAFAELEKFMDQKLKNYSSGMQVRLAFSIAIRAQSAILLLDEVLAVGDANFQKKCYDYFRQLKQDKRTVIFVSHDSNALLEYCDRGLLLEQGKIVTIDRIDHVVNEYMDVLSGQQDLQEAASTATKKRWGSGEISIEKAETTSADGQARAKFSDDDSEMVIRVTYRAKKAVKQPVYGIIVTDENNNRVFASNTDLKKLATSDLKDGQTVSVEWRLPNAFNSGTFQVSPAAAEYKGNTIYDWQENACKFRVNKNLKSPAFINIEHELSVKAGRKSA